MFAVIYQGYVKPERELDYQQNWNTIARYFIEHRGALGSSLHRGEDGLWVAYSRWPDKGTRDVSWPDASRQSKALPDEIEQAIAILKECIDQERKIPEICLQVVADLWLNQVTE